MGAIAEVGTELDYVLDSNRPAHRTPGNLLLWHSKVHPRAKLCAAANFCLHPWEMGIAEMTCHQGGPSRKRMLM